MNETLKWKGLRLAAYFFKRPFAAYEWNPEMKGIETNISSNLSGLEVYEWNPEMKGIETHGLCHVNSRVCMNETLKWKGLRRFRARRICYGEAYEWNPEMKGIETPQNV